MNSQIYIKTISVNIKDKTQFVLMILKLANRIIENKVRYQGVTNTNARGVIYMYIWIIKNKNVQVEKNWILTLIILMGILLVHCQMMIIVAINFNLILVNVIVEIRDSVGAINNVLMIKKFKN